MCVVSAGRKAGRGSVCVTMKEKKKKKKGLHHKQRNTELFHRSPHSPRLPTRSRVAGRPALLLALPPVVDREGGRRVSEGERGAAFQPPHPFPQHTMLESQLAFLLQRYLGDYVSGLDKSALEVSVLRGDVTLTNLSLKPGALDGLALPVTVRAGLLGRLSLRIPWANLRGSPVVVEVDRLYILAGPADADANAASAPATPSAAAAADAALTRKLVDDAELDWVQAVAAGVRSAGADLAASAADADDRGGGLLRGLADVIVGNLQLSITNVHIRYEDEAGGGAPGAPPLAAGVTLARLDARTVDADGAPAFVAHDPLSLLRKAAALTRLAAYFDAGAEPWPPPRGAASWAAVPPAAWDALFADGVRAAPAVSSRGGGGTTTLLSSPGLAAATSGPAATRQYILRPVGGKAAWTRRGPRARARRRPARPPRMPPCPWTPSPCTCPAPSTWACKPSRKRWTPTAPAPRCATCGRRVGRGRQVMQRARGGSMQAPPSASASPRRGSARGTRCCHCWRCASATWTRTQRV